MNKYKYLFFLYFCFQLLVKFLLVAYKQHTLLMPPWLKLTTLTVSQLYITTLVRLTMTNGSYRVFSCNANYKVGYKNKIETGYATRK